MEGRKEVTEDGDEDVSIYLMTKEKIGCWKLNEEALDRVL